MVNVVVGDEEQAFPVHRDLLALHSPHFSERLTAGITKILLPHVGPLIFADFVSWMYTGDVLNTGPRARQALPGLRRISEGWTLGRFLKAPGFQNRILDFYRLRSRCAPNNWVCIELVEATYGVSNRGSLIRRYTADLLSYNSPFTPLEEGSASFKVWEALLERIPDLKHDLAVRIGKQWNGSHPWDEKNRESYVKAEVSLDEKWEKMILAKRCKPRTGIEEDAEAGGLKDNIHLDHLERNA
jgi:hypothetical protein